jgi:hypothetical protein
MSDQKVVSLRPYVAALDVCVELPLMSISTWLCFGPFDSEGSASEWLAMVETLHAASGGGDSAHLYRLQGATDRSTPFLTCVIMGTDVQNVVPAFRTKGELIEPCNPTDTAGKILTYALMAVQQAISTVLSVPATSPPPSPEPALGIFFIIIT